jgi:hypothetical protein
MGLARLCKYRARGFRVRAAPCASHPDRDAPRCRRWAEGTGPFDTRAPIVAFRYPDATQLRHRQTLGIYEYSTGILAPARSALQCLAIDHNRRPTAVVYRILWDVLGLTEICVPRPSSELDCSCAALGVNAAQGHSFPHYP